MNEITKLAEAVSDAAISIGLRAERAQNLARITPPPEVKTCLEQALAALRRAGSAMDIEFTEPPRDFAVKDWAAAPLPSWQVVTGLIHSKTS